MKGVRTATKNAFDALGLNAVVEDIPDPVPVLDSSSLRTRKHKTKFGMTAAFNGERCDDKQCRDENCNDRIKPDHAPMKVNFELSDEHFPLLTRCMADGLAEVNQTLQLEADAEIVRQERLHIGAPRK